MNLSNVLKLVDCAPSESEMVSLKRATKEFVARLKKEIKKNKIRADVFVGGSFAKGTLAKSDNYDIDVFVRFVDGKKDVSNETEKILQKMNVKHRRLHGSRDYFSIAHGASLTFEIIPVMKIKNVRGAQNVTDLSYFHVNFVKKNVTEKMKREISLAKVFFKAQRVYGAESYIGGFSGYAIECLIAHYKTFEKLLREIVKVSREKKIVLDLKKFYKNSHEALIHLNESKTQSPIVLVDPTWKDRNVLAALTWDTFEQLQERTRAFLKSPSIESFKIHEISASEFQKIALKKKAEFAHVILETDRQEGDIAGTKMKKFARHLVEVLKEYFVVVENDFSYGGEKNADVYIVATPKKEIVREGPFSDDAKNAAAFRAANKTVFAKGKKLFARIPISFSVKEFLEKFSLEEKMKTLKDMSITEMKVVESN